LTAFLLTVLLSLPSAAYSEKSEASKGLGGELSGYLSTEARLFAHPPLFTGQSEHSVSLALQPEYYIERVEKLNGASLTFVPFLRLDSADPERTHFDIRELFTLWLFDAWELAAGARKIFWGVTESAHLVDIINQTDLIENGDGEEKLGQPMISASIAGDAGGGYTLDLFFMPWFRERTFPGRSGRLRSSKLIDTDRAEYESGAEEFSPDLALRYARTIEEWEIGLTLFNGTGREPTLVSKTDSNGDAVFIPRYVQILQTGIDLQWTGEEWLWKLELIGRKGQGDEFAAWAGGFEYTLYNIRSSGIDIGLLAEWLHDTRGGVVPLDDDIFAGVRLTLNDAASTDLLAGIIQDLDSNARILFMESGRRFGNNLRATLEARIFADQPASDPLYYLRKDDFIQLDLAYWF
jgi:hypothetical protein